MTPETRVQRWDDPSCLILPVRTRSSQARVNSAQVSLWVTSLLKGGAVKSHSKAGAGDEGGSFAARVALDPDSSSLPSVSGGLPEPPEHSS